MSRPAYAMEPSALPPLADLNALRLEGMVILERCLRDQQAAAFDRFLAAQFDAEAPPLQLLQELAQDVAQRLQTLRQEQFDRRELLLRQLNEATLEDWSGVLPTELSAYMIELLTLSLADIVPAERTGILFTVLDEAQRAVDDIQIRQRMLTQVFGSLQDWARALSVITARQGQREDSGQFVQNIWYTRL